MNIYIKDNGPINRGSIRNVKEWQVRFYADPDFSIYGPLLDRKLKLVFEGEKEIKDCLDVIKETDIQPRKVNFSYAMGFVQIFYQSNKIGFSENL